MENKNNDAEKWLRECDKCMPRKNNYGQFGRNQQSTCEETPPAKRPALEPRFSSHDPDVSFDDLGGCEAQQLEALELTLPLKFWELSLKRDVVPTNGVILHGPPGTGKTSFAKALARELELPLFFISSTLLVAGISGDSERRIRDLFTEVVNAAPAVLVLDDIDIIASKRENAQREMERRIVTQLAASMKDLKRKPVLVVGTTSRVEVLDASLRNSFGQEIAFGIPDEIRRLKILEIITKDKKIGLDVSLPQLARLTPGYVGSDLYTLVQKVSNCAFNRVLLKAAKSLNPTPVSSVPLNPREQEYERICAELNDLKSLLRSSETAVSDQLADDYITFDDFTEALKIVVPSAKREGFATVPDVKWSDIGALSVIRSELTWSILHPIQRPECFDDFSVKPRPQGILLCGPPGCGKTLLAKAVANETGMNFISVKGPELLSMYVGESERSVRTVFQRARDSSPCVIFFDEIDSLCPKRSHNENSGASRIVNQFLTEMDGMETRKQVFLIGATNRPDILDPAVIRPGRFDQVIFVDFPNGEDRADILRTITKNGKRPRLAPSVNLDQLARDSRMEYFTGADIVALVHQAGIAAMKERIESGDITLDAITMRHFEVALKKVSPSVGEEDRNRYERMRRQYANR